MFFYDKNAHKLGIVRTHLNMIKAIYYKCKASIIHNSKKLKAFHLRSGYNTRMPTLATFI